MIRFLLKRLLNMIPLLIAISFIAFAILRLAPGDFVTTLSQDPNLSQETIQRMRADYGLDKPWLVQYFLWLGNALRLNFGVSLQYHIAVSTLLAQRLGNTLLLSICALIFAWGVGVPLGVIAAVRRNTIVDRSISLFAFATISFPGFFLALLLLLMAHKTGWFPIGGMHDTAADLMSPTEQFWDVARHLVLPVLVLGIGGSAGIMRQMRGSLLDTLRENYITASRARGLSERVVIWKHAFRNAINPLITIFGLSLAGLLSGSALVENVMSWPGLGRLILEAVQSGDQYVVMGSFVMSASLLLLGNLFSDVLLALTDPRIKLGRS
jgi:peptide/nickel transport system permease protein